MRIAAVDDGAVVAGQDIVHHRRVGGADRLALAGFDLTELEAGVAKLGAQTPGAQPGQGNGGGDEDEEGEPQLARPAVGGGKLGSFGGGHLAEDRG